MFKLLSYSAVGNVASFGTQSQSLPVGAVVHLGDRIAGKIATSDGLVKIEDPESQRLIANGVLLGLIEKSGGYYLIDNIRKSEFQKPGRAFTVTKRDHATDEWGFQKLYSPRRVPNRNSREVQSTRLFLSEIRNIERAIRNSE
jgi:hypothetical protein